MHLFVLFRLIREIFALFRHISNFSSLIAGGNPLIKKINSLILHKILVRFLFWKSNFKLPLKVWKSTIFCKLIYFYNGLFLFNPFGSFDWMEFEHIRRCMNENLKKKSVHTIVFIYQYMLTYYQKLYFRFNHMLTEDFLVILFSLYFRRISESLWWWLVCCKKRILTSC